jgi:hypothetical protein
MQMVDTSECNMPKSDADRANVIATRYRDSDVLLSSAWIYSGLPNTRPRRTIKREGDPL